MVHRSRWPRNMKSFSAVPFPATPVVLFAALFLSLSPVNTSHKKVSCYHCRSACRLTADLALQPMSYTKRVQHKVYFRGVCVCVCVCVCRFSLFFNSEGNYPSVWLVERRCTSRTIATDPTERGKHNPLSKYSVVSNNNSHERLCSFCLLFCMGVKLGRSHWRRNVGWGCLRTGCWGEYLGLKGRGNSGVEKTT